MTVEDRVPCPRGCGATFLPQPIRAIALHECSRQKNGDRYKDQNYRVEIEVYVGGPDVGLETSDPKVGREPTPSRRTPAASNPGKKRQPIMSNEEETSAPKPGRGYTVVELRTSHQSEMVKNIVKGTKAGAVGIDDRWVIVKNSDAQLVVDKAIAADVTEFENRVVSYFLAVLLLGNHNLVDSRNTVQSRLIEVGRKTKGFAVGMKPDNKLEVSVGRTKYPTSKAALEALAPDLVKSPSASVTSSEDRTARASRKAEDVETFKSQKAALKAWEETPENERGPRPKTDILDRMTRENAEKKTRRAETAKTRKEVTPRFKSSTRRAAS